MSVPKYVQRIARLPGVFELLAAHPSGLALVTLAAEVGVPADELREDLMAFYSADVGPELLMGLSRPEVLEFLGPDGEDEDPNDAEVVRVSDPRPFDELGVEYVDAAELALVYTAATALLEIEPDNDDLAGAVDVLAETMFVGPGEVALGETALAPLQQAQRDRRRVRIVYSRAWASGVRERVIEPYHLVQTRRGWEVDAGPLDDDGLMRTYLLSNIREVEVLSDGFEPPSNLAERLGQQRQTETVRVRVPQSARWAADMYAEQVHVVQDDELTATLDLELLPPLEHRVGMLMLACGREAEVFAPAGLRSCGPDLAATLLAHHRRT